MDMTMPPKTIPLKFRCSGLSFMATLENPGDKLQQAHIQEIGDRLVGRPGLQLRHQVLSWTIHDIIMTFR